MRQANRDRKTAIQIELLRAGVKQRDVARRAGVSPPTVFEVIAGVYPAATEKGQQTIAKVEAAIVELTGNPNVFAAL